MIDIEDYETVTVPGSPSPKKSSQSPKLPSPSPKGKKGRRKISRRKRTVRPKQRGLYAPRNANPEVVLTEAMQEHTYATPSPFQVFDVEMMEEPETNAEDNCASTAVKPSKDIEVDSIAPIIDNQTKYVDGHNVVVCPSSETISKALGLLQNTLPDNWIVIADREGFHLLLLCSSTIKTVQREIYLLYNGSVSIVVHCSKLPSDNEVMKFSPTPIIFNDANYPKFCQRGLDLCWNMKQFQVCTGADHLDSMDIWSYVQNSYVDLNPYMETTYESSCRSKDCHRLIPLRLNTSRCSVCSKILKSLKDRIVFAQQQDFSSNTPNMYLNQEKSQVKLKMTQEEKVKAKKRASYLESKILKLLDDEGVDLDEESNNDFASILNSAEMTEMQKMFLEEQLKCAGKKDPRARRWHPAMIRLAIQIKSISTSAYETIRNSGAIILPSTRTLFDYTSSISASEGVNKGLLEMVAKQVKSKKNGYQKFHSLIFDEMYVSQNLVYRKSDGALVGYAHLDEVDREMKRFENYLEGKSELDSNPPPLASTILAYMVKGLTSDVKCVFASYPSRELNKCMIYARTWEVIALLEGAGIKVLTLVCDGSPINRAFFKLHAPITTTESGIVFDTVNFASEDGRPLYFVADVAHLLKTIRNCLYNSREGEEEKFRHLTINGQSMLWKFIIRLYYTEKGDTLRKSYKLNAQNVFPTSYSTMRVKYAAQVLSQTVANDLKSKNWPGTEELVKFIEKVNKFFDILNGAHSSQASKTMNENLAPYTDPNDKRFDWLENDFLAYIKSWKKQVEDLNVSAKEKAKMLLSYQTLEGIEITIKGFTAAVRFLLVEQKAKFVMARAFSQDPLEQHFSRQRARGGGNTHPSVAKTQRNQVVIATHDQLRSHHRGANFEKDDTPSVVSNEPVPKRHKTKR